MKRPLIFFGMLFLVQTIFLIPSAIAANSVFDEDVIRCGASPVNCGSNPPASDPLTSGSVVVGVDGSVRVTLHGAAANSTYTLFIGRFWDSYFFPEYLGGGSCSGQDIGTVVTDSYGDYIGPIINYSGSNFVFPAGTSITQLNFVFNNPPCEQTQFTTGITIR